MAHPFRFQRLRNEFESGNPGRHWLDLILSICDQVTRNGFPASFYAKSIEFAVGDGDKGKRWSVEDSTSIWGDSWSPEALNSLANDVFLLLGTDRSPIGMSFKSIIEAVMLAEVRSHSSAAEFSPEKFTKFFVHRAVRSTLRFRVERGVGSRFFARWKAILEGEPFVFQGTLVDDELGIGGRAYGLEGVTEVSPLGNVELSRASAIIRTFPVEKPSVSDDARQNQKRSFTDSTLRQMAESIARSTGSALTVKFVLTSLKSARPELFPLSIRPAGTAADPGQLSGKNSSSPTPIWNDKGTSDLLQLEERADLCASAIVSALDKVDSRMAVVLARQSRQESLREIGTALDTPVSGQYVGQLIAKSHSVIRETFGTLTQGLDLLEEELSYFKSCVLGGVLAMCNARAGGNNAGG